jgi:hypothetical protein
MAPTQGFFYMGIMVIGMTALYATVYFPMWGGMFCAAKPGVTEEDYYMSGGGRVLRTPTLRKKVNYVAQAAFEYCCMSNGAQHLLGL